MVLDEQPFAPDSTGKRGLYTSRDHPRPEEAYCQADYWANDERTRKPKRMDSYYFFPVLF